MTDLIADDVKSVDLNQGYYECEILDLGTDTDKWIILYRFWIRLSAKLGLLPELGCKLVVSRCCQAIFNLLKFQRYAHTKIHFKIILQLYFKFSSANL